jgi:GT2 family glycosyltransferase
MILVNDSGKKEKSKKIERMAGKVFAGSPQRLTILPKPKSKGALSRNEGFKKVRGDIVVLIAPDACPAKDWLENLLRPYQDKKVSAVGGLVINPGRQPTVGLGIAAKFQVDRGKDAKYGRAESLNGANMSVRRDILYRLGLFDKNLGRLALAEDLDLGLGVRELGGRVFYNPQARVTRCRAPEEGRADLKNGVFWLMRSRTYVMLKHHRFFTPYVILRALFYGLSENTRRPDAHRRLFLSRSLRGFFPTVGGWLAGLRLYYEKRTQRKKKRKTEKKIWRKALFLPGRRDLTASFVEELASFYAISKEEAREKMSAAEKELADKFRKCPDPEKFYQNNKLYSFSLAGWHADLPLQTLHFNLAALALARKISAALPSPAPLLRFLDFGAGIGSAGILFARYGCKVTLADVDASLLEFAKWRFAKRDLPVCIINLQKQE